MGQISSSFLPPQLQLELHKQSTLNPLPKLQSRDSPVWNGKHASWNCSTDLNIGPKKRSGTQGCVYPSAMAEAPGMGESMPDQDPLQDRPLSYL